MLYTLAFLVFGTKRGLAFSLGLYLSSLLAALSYFLFVPLTNVVDGAGTLLVQGAAAGGITLFLLAAIGRVVALQVRAAAQLERVASTDPLTLLSNRRHIIWQLEQETSRVQRQNGTFSVAFLDIDHFKYINDTFGHVAGDKTLVAVGKLFSKNTRSVDVVGRWGGEEFVILLPGLSLAQAREAIERLRELVAEHPFKKVRHLTASFGVAEYRPGEPLETLLQRADRALYQAKAEGRNQVVTALDTASYQSTTPDELLN